MAGKFTNNASSTLAGSISAAATSITVNTGEGALFPILGAGDWCRLTLTKLVGGLAVREIVKATARSSDIFTIVRAQEGTTALTFTAGDIVDLRVTAGVLSDLAPLDSPALINNPTAPTQVVSDDTTKLATTAFANRAAANAVAQVAGATATLASAATVNIGAAGVGNIAITGVTAITAFDIIAEGTLRWLVFGAALVLTHHATALQLPGSANIATAPGDVAMFKSLGGGNWKCMGYSRASGIGLVAASATVSGYLTSTDWSTFNGKQAALGYTPLNVAGGTMTGALTLIAGTLALPGLSFSGDTNTGLYQASNGTVSVSCDGNAVTTFADASISMSRRVIIDTTGVTGIPLSVGNTSAAMSVELVGPGANPKKYIRVNNGVIDIMNNAFSASICSITDAGTLSAPVITQTSDERKKRNWKPLTDAQLDALADMKLSGTFEWIENGEASVGGSAQEIGAIVPQAINIAEDGGLSVNYGGLNFAILQAMLRRQKEIA